MIITDGTHLVSTESEEELHKFAESIGPKRHWYQDLKNHGHYDLTTLNASGRAVRAGAKLVHAFDLVQQAWWSKLKRQEVKNG